MGVTVAENNARLRRLGIFPEDQEDKIIDFNKPSPKREPSNGTKRNSRLMGEPQKRDPSPTRQKPVGERKSVDPVLFLDPKDKIIDFNKPSPKREPFFDEDCPVTVAENNARLRRLGIFPEDQEDKIIDFNKPSPKREPS